MELSTQFSKCLSFLLYFPIITAIAYLAIHFLVYSRRMAQWHKANIPFIKPSFQGHVYCLNFINKSFLVGIDRVYKENPDKDLIGFFGGTLPIILLRSPTIIRQVFAKNFDNTFELGIFGARTNPILQHMLAVSAEKGVWQSDRKILSPMLTASRLSGKAFDKITKQIASMWAHVQMVHSEGRPIDVKQVVEHFIMDGTSHSFFGLEADSYKKHGELLKMTTKLLRNFTLFEMFRNYCLLQFFDVNFIQNFEYYKKWQIDMITRFTRYHMMNHENLHEDEDNFTNFLMRLNDGEEVNKQESSINITDRMVAYTFTVAAGAYIGQTSLAIFAIHLLSLHPEHEERIRQEVTKAMEKHKTSEFTYEVVQDLHFTEQCLLETLRLYPVQKSTTRICSADFKILGTDYTIKKGDRVIICAYSVQRDPKYFKNPDEFDPERFSPENISTIPHDTFLAFGIGPRECIGDTVTLLMVKTFIGSLLYKFKIIPYSHDRQMDANDFEPRRLSIRPREDVQVYIVQR